MGFLGLFRPGRLDRAGFSLYGAAVTAGRDPYCYTELGVPDTLDGRFDLVGLHTYLLIRRLRALAAPGPALAQAVFDAMFSDMDINLRELGVGDLSVGKRVRAMWEAFHGRARAYDAAFESSDAAELAAALARNIWRGMAPEDEAVAGLARLVRAQAAALERQELAGFVAGRARFLAASDAASNAALGASA